MTAYCFKHARCVTLDPPSVFEADVLIEDEHIAAVADSVTPGEQVEVINLDGKILMPGLVCAHTHLYSTLARGMPGPSVPPENFLQILERIWWKLDRALDQESLYLSALVGAIEAVRAGTTCLIDHHASPNFIRGSIGMVAQAMEEIGVRGVVCYEITDRGGQQERDAALDESYAVLDHVRDGLPAPDLIRALLGAHASFTLSDDTLNRCAHLVQLFETGLHIHVAEDAYDEAHAQTTYGRTVIDRLAQFGLLNDKTLLAHGVHLSPQEILTVQQAGCWLVHNPRSNLNNSVGRAPVESFGVRVALGTDGIGADMFEESKFAFFRAREATRQADAQTYLRMLANGNAIIAPLFNKRFGVIEPGAMADLVILDYVPPTPLHADNLAWHWMFGMNATLVESVMVGGQFVYRDRRFPGFDPAPIYQAARQAAQALWQRMMT
ncbi:MAG: putative aminohydrolase SsnA [Acidobacteriota bacterium]|nr:putative aminohydrolase SsnA [Blastocatellia bacterium]MDW8239783.1 putative aminohydrolase SsnA [Acidobacteriota bacterium]